MSENSFLSYIFNALPMKSSENLVRFMSPNLLNIHWERKFINNPSDWFWQNLNSLSFLLTFSCDLNQSIPPFHPKCNVHCSEYWKIESVLNSIHTQNIDSFVLLSLLDGLFSDPIKLFTSQFLFLSITITTLDAPITIQIAIMIAAMPPPLIPPSKKEKIINM